MIDDSIKVVTNRPWYFQGLGWTHFAELSEVLNYDGKIIQFDFETTGLDFFADLHCCQIGFNNQSYVIDLQSPMNPTGIPIIDLKEFIESKSVIGHNLAFDLMFAYRNNIVPRKVWDTRIMEVLLALGFAYQKNDFGSTVKRRLDIQLDKEPQGSIAKAGLSSKEYIMYSGNDVLPLEDVMWKQSKQIKKDGMVAAAKLENKFVPVMAYLEYCGFGFDPVKFKEAWLPQVKKYERDSLSALKKYYRKHYRKNYSKHTGEERKEVLWSSPEQVADIFTFIGLDVSDPKKKRGVSVAEDNIRKYKDEWEIVSLYLDYKAAQKNSSTYGENWLSYPMKNGRIHTKWNQLVSTGRTSCGNVKKGPFPNAQNVPQSNDFRNCIVAAPGHKLIICDYSGQESVILADISGEENLLKFYKRGQADLHSFVASLVFNEPYEEIAQAKSSKDNGETITDRQKYLLKRRQDSKDTGFLIVYGGGAWTLANRLQIPQKKAQGLIDAYLNAFPGLRKFFDNQRYKAMRNSYIPVNPKTGKRRYMMGFEKFKKQYNSFDWDKYRAEKAKKSKKYEEVLKPECSYIMNRKGMIERDWLNTPIQGLGADMLKLAGIYIFDEILNNNHFGIVKMPLEVHDEWVLEAPNHLAEQYAEITKTCMEKAGNFFLNHLTIKAQPEISDCWKK